jgi:hypothetical protein
MRLNGRNGREASKPLRRYGARSLKVCVAGISTISSNGATTPAPRGYSTVWWRTIWKRGSQLDRHGSVPPPKKTASSTCDIQPVTATLAPNKSVPRGSERHEISDGAAADALPIALRRCQPFAGSQQRARRDLSTAADRILQAGIEDHLRDRSDLLCLMREAPADPEVGQLKIVRGGNVFWPAPHLDRSEQQTKATFGMEPNCRRGVLRRQAEPGPSGRKPASRRRHWGA